MKLIKLFFLGILFLINYFSFGQSNKIDIGFEGSPSISSIRGNDLLKEYQKITIGFTSGLFFQLNINEPFSLRTNIAFEKKRILISVYATDEYGNTGNLRTYGNFDYIIVPLLFKGTYGQKIKYFANVGPYIGVLLKQTMVTKLLTNKNFEQDDTHTYKPYDYGVTCGIGILYPLKKNLSISFELRENLGLYDILKPSDLYIEKDEIKTNSINFLFGISYHLCEKQKEQINLNEQNE